MRWWALVAACLGLSLGLGSPTAATAATSQPASSSTTTSGPLTLAQWTQKYEPVIGVIADDVVVVVDTGQKEAKHPTKKKVAAAISACRKWHSDAESVPGKAPPIPSNTAQQSWQGLIDASLAASADCTTALEHGSRNAARGFHRQLVRVHRYEGLLVKELGSASQ